MSRSPDLGGTAATGGAPSYYLSSWYFDFLPGETAGLDEVIRAFQAELERFREMRAAGVELARVNFASGIDEFSDHVVLFTTDPAVARRFNFDPEPLDEAEWEEYRGRS
jgi:hypothetical protein